MIAGRVPPPLPRCCMPTDTRRSRSASGTTRPPRDDRMGPFDRWPTGYGFDYFYGFSQAKHRNTSLAYREFTAPIEPSHDREVSPRLGSGRQGDHRGCTRRQAFPRQTVLHVIGRPVPAHGPLTVFKESADGKRQVRCTAGCLCGTHLRRARSSLAGSRRCRANTAPEYHGLVGLSRQSSAARSSSG